MIVDPLRTGLVWSIMLVTVACPAQTPVTSQDMAQVSSQSGNPLGYTNESWPRREQSSPGATLPKLSYFLERAKSYSAENRSATALAQQRGAEADQALLVLFPSLSATAGYTRNQYEVIAQIPNGPNSLRSATFTPTNQWDATVSLDVPIIDTRNFLQLKAARSNRQAALADAANTEQDIATQVGTAYYQLVGADALQASAEQAAATAEQNLQIVQTRLQSGLASELDADRARTEIERDHQSVEEAKLLGQQARRALRRYTGVEPTGTIPKLEPSGVSEGALLQWTSGVESMPAIRAAVAKVNTAQMLADAAYAPLLPSLSASARERITNAVGFGQSPYWAAGLTATWHLSASDEAAIRAGQQSLSVARAELDRVRRVVRDGIEDEYDQVRSQRVRVSAALAQQRASQQAADVARVRYTAGTATHLELLQAERDAFAAQVAYVQACADLELARFLLRLRAGRALGSEP